MSLADDLNALGLPGEYEGLNAALDKLFEGKGPGEALELLEVVQTLVAGIQGELDARKAKLLAVFDAAGQNWGH